MQPETKSMTAVPTDGGGHDKRLQPQSRFEEVWDSHRDVLWRSLFAMSGGDKAIVDDALAEAFARAIVNEREIRDAPAWIYRTASRVLRSELKRRAHAVEFESDIETADAPQAVSSEGLQELIWALRQLSPNQRSAVILHYEMGLSTAEVAKYMGVQASTVRVHLFRAKKSLRQLLAEAEENGGHDD